MVDHLRILAHQVGGNSANGDRRALLRELGAALAGLGAAEQIAALGWLPKEAKVSKRDLQALVREAERGAGEGERAASALAAAEKGEHDGGQYFVERGLAGTPFLYWRKITAEGIMPVVVAHFVPRVVGEKVRHLADGQILRVLSCQLETVVGVVSFDVLPEDAADPRRFYGACVHAAGADARLVNAGGARHLWTAAAELADPGREREHVFEFTGWREVGGRLVYLSAGGAIGEGGEGVRVDLSTLAAGVGVSGLAQFGPRENEEDLRMAVRGLGEVVRGSYPDSVLLPGLAAVFLAPAQRWAPAPDRPALHYVGATGTRKTALLALLQSFYGVTEPTLTWRGTANSIEIALSALGDCVVTVDDLKASTSDRGGAQKIMQSAADRRGRTRATRTGELARARFVGGLLVSAGEDIPAGEASVAARALFLPVARDDARLDYLTAAQNLAPFLSAITAGYIRWLLGRDDELRDILAERFDAARGRYRDLLQTRRGINDAGRVATNCALLECGAQLAAQWLGTQGWTAAQCEEWAQATRAALETAAEAQAQAITDESAARAWLDTLQALIDGRRVELRKVEKGAALPALADCLPPNTGATVIGWDVGPVWYLDPALTWGMVQQWRRAQGEGLTITKRGLYAQLQDGGFLAEVDDRGGKNEIVKWIGGKARRVLAVRSDALQEHSGAGEAPLLA